MVVVNGGEPLCIVGTLNCVICQDTDLTVYFTVYLPYSIPPFYHPYAKIITSALDIIRIQITVHHYYEFSIYIEIISDWTLIFCIQFNQTHVLCCLLACIYSLAAPLNSAIHTIMPTGSHPYFTTTVSPAWDKDF